MNYDPDIWVSSKCKVISQGENKFAEGKTFLPVEVRYQTHRHAWLLCFLDADVNMKLYTTTV